MDMFSGNLEVVSLGGRIWHILQRGGCDRRCSAGAISGVAADQASKYGRAFRTYWDTDARKSDRGRYSNVRMAINGSMGVDSN